VYLATKDHYRKFMVTIQQQLVQQNNTATKLFIHQSKAYPRNQLLFQRFLAMVRLHWRHVEPFPFLQQK